MDKITIAIDGPAGAGKSTISKLLAEKLGIEYMDTGAMYRAIALKFKIKGTKLIDIDSVKELLRDTDIRFEHGKLFLDSAEVTNAIRMPDITEKVSAVAAIPEVRAVLVGIQRKIASEKSIIMDGRDIGSNVLKDASFKFYLNASIEERAKRRYQELTQKGYIVNIEDVLNEIIKRDESDMNRKLNPLIKSPDALEIDTTGKTISEVVDIILDNVNR